MAEQTAPSADPADYPTLPFYAPFIEAELIACVCAATGLDPADLASGDANEWPLERLIRRLGSDYQRLRQYEPTLADLDALDPPPLDDHWGDRGDGRDDDEVVIDRGYLGDLGC